MTRFPGLVAAVFTPFDDTTAIDTTVLARTVDRLVADGVRGLFVCGTSGEGPSLTEQERKLVAAEYVRAAAGRVACIVHCGHNSLRTASQLAAHAAEIGADAIAAAPPSYFRPNDLATLVACMEEVARGAPELPFYYYHIPPLTGVELSMTDFLETASRTIGNLAGIKFSSTHVMELQRCVERFGDRFEMLFGVDEMLLSGLAGGATGAVGSTYNIAAPLYNRILGHFHDGDLAAAQRLQGLAARMVDVQVRLGGLSAIRATMSLLGEDFGPPRLPLAGCSATTLESLRRELQDIGFFDWART